MKPRVAIIDSGGANIASLTAALDRLHADHLLTTDETAIRDASHVILPGVGAAADAMRRLKARGLDELIPTLTRPVHAPVAEAVASRLLSLPLYPGIRPDQQALVAGALRRAVESFR